MSMLFIESERIFFSLLKSKFRNSIDTEKKNSQGNMSCISLKENLKGFFPKIS